MPIVLEIMKRAEGRFAGDEAGHVLFEGESAAAGPAVVGAGFGDGFECVAGCCCCGVAWEWVSIFAVIGGGIIRWIDLLRRSKDAEPG